MKRLSRWNKVAKGVAEGIYKTQESTVNLMKTANWKLDDIEDFKSTNSHSSSGLSFKLKGEIDASINMDVLKKASEVNIVANVDSDIKDIIHTYIFLLNTSQTYDKFINIKNAIEKAKVHEGILIKLNLSEDDFIEGSIICKNGHIYLSTQYVIQSLL